MEFGRNVFDHIWSTISDTTARTTGIQPTPPSPAVNYFGEGVTTTAPCCAPSQAPEPGYFFPALAPAVPVSTLIHGSIPASMPYSTIATTAPRPIFAPPQAPELGFVPAQSSSAIPTTIPIPMELPAPRSTITAAVPMLGLTSNPAPHLTVQLTEQQKRLVLSNARDGVLKSMFTQSAIPDRSSRKALIDQALSSALVEVVGTVMVTLPKNAERKMKLMMGNVHCHFRHYCLCHIHREFGLRLPPGQSGSEIDHRAQRVRDLLTGFEFL